MIEKCNEFLSEYLPKNPKSNLLDIIYMYDLSLTVNNFIEKIKKDFNIIFEERIEKYVFLRLTADELHKLLKLRSFNSTDEYYFVKGIRLWLEYATKNRLDNALSLFSLINYRSCSKNLMLENKIINSGNCKMDEIVKQLHLNIYFLNDPAALDLLDYYKVQSIDSFNIPPNVIKQPNISSKQLSKQPNRVMNANNFISNQAMHVNANDMQNNYRYNVGSYVHTNQTHNCYN